MSPFLPPPLKVFKISPLILFPKNIQTNSEQFSTNPSQSLGPLALIILSKRMISPSNISLLTMPSQLFQAATWQKNAIESVFRLFPVHPDDWQLMGMFWNGQYYFDKVLPFRIRSAPYIFNQLSDAIEY